MKRTIKLGSVLILVGLLGILSLPTLAAAGGGGANTITGFDCTISLVEIGGSSIVTEDTFAVETPKGNVLLKCRADLPQDLEPPDQALRTTGELCTTDLGTTTDSKKVITPRGKVTLTCHINGKPLPTAGWAIGNSSTGIPTIVHTADGGQTWQTQGDLSAWAGYDGTDISAVDARTAWAALGTNADETGGAILHTTDGGVTWISQTIPSDLAGGIKGVRGLSRNEAWAASLRGTILHTTDGGSTWDVVPHPTVSIAQVNRMDAMGGDVWIADVGLSWNNDGAVVHTQDGGLTWRAEPLPNEDSPLTVHAFSPTSVWASGNEQLAFFRTVDGGDRWTQAGQSPARDHLDDICAAGPDNVWGVQNGDGLSGTILWLHMTAGGTADVRDISPRELRGYTPGGISCVDTRTAWVVAQRGVLTDDSWPYGIILHTEDGETWVQQSAPDDIKYWKISFAGAMR